MNNYTMELYEMKREIINFSKKVSSGLDKPIVKFVEDMQYGLSKSGSCLISEISRALNEKIKLIYTIERLCDNLNNLKDTEYIKIENNYLQEVINYFGEEPISIFDDSDISKRYGRCFEDLDRVIDASSQNKEVVNGYHVCEAVVLTEKELQPVSVYSKVYSCKSKGFESTKTYTIESIKRVISLLQRKCNMVFDRGYDDNKIIDFVDKSKNNFVIRMNDKRTFLFKGKKKNCFEEAKKRKGKVRMLLTFNDDEKIEINVSHTRVTLPYNKKDYELVFVYGLSEEQPMILLTNRTIHSKEDLIKVVRLYFYRWRVEEYFRAKKQEYDFENIRIRSLKGINNLNLMLTIHMGHLAIIGEKIDTNLLTIKIIERSKSLRNRTYVWLSQLARGINAILVYARVGIERCKEIEQRCKYKQLSLKL